MLIEISRNLECEVLQINLTLYFLRFSPFFENFHKKRCELRINRTLKIGEPKMYWWSL